MPPAKELRIYLPDERAANLGIGVGRAVIICTLCRFIAREIRDCVPVHGVRNDFPRNTLRQ